MSDEAKTLLCEATLEALADEIFRRAPWNEIGKSVIVLLMQKPGENTPLLYRSVFGNPITALGMVEQTRVALIVAIDENEKVARKKARESTDGR